MDDKLIDRLSADAKDWAGDGYIKRDLQDAITAIETLRTELARVTLARWELEKMGYIDVGRTLPSEYLYFSGNGEYNTYRTEYIGGVEYVPGDVA